MSFFTSLNLDIRLIIYEYATWEPKKLVPQQVTKRSNKFTWGDGEDKPLTVTQLSRTCRQFYRELSSCPVFYRVNIFTFDSPSDLHSFLAAITPARRHMIRNIEVCTEPDIQPPRCGEWRTTDLGNNLYGTQFGHVFTLLCDCRDLRQITFNTAIYLSQTASNTVMHMMRALIDILTSILSQSQSTHHGAHSLWNLPGFDIGFLLYHDFRTSRRAKMSMPSFTPKLSQYVSAKTAPGTLQYDDIKDSLCKAHTALVENRNRQQQNPPTYPTDKQIHDAVQAADLDFSGEARISQKRSVGFRDTISRRTRGQLKAESNVTEMGTIIKEDPKYDIDGMLIRRIVEVRDVRWNGQVIECLVRGRQDDDSPRWTSWEEIHHLANYNILTRVRIFYNRLYRFGVNTPREWIERINQMPRLEDIAYVLDGLMVGDKPQGWDHLWKAEAVLRDPRIKVLEKRIEFLEQREKAKAEAKAEAKKQREEEKKAKKAKKNAEQSSED